MGHYTEMHYNVKLVERVPKKVIDVLTYLGGTSHAKPPETLPDHALFSTARWGMISVGRSYYINTLPHYLFQRDPISKTFFLGIKTQIKNYENELELFIDWIDPWVDAEKDDFLGFIRDESSQDPILVRKKTHRFDHSPLHQSKE